ncbi:hypothetical protein [Cellulomonas sp. RIT-PI-Y]|uniref:hypothetical protein n=1 Tax=Cellulomonas sp. RIT-PI-Y TaxID=3035297 RepID=UPI0021D9D035|nr:hypothetical protein [Cellulomonas sp. RIT-PI-Y]
MTLGPALSGLAALLLLAGCAGGVDPGDGTAATATPTASESDTATLDLTAGSSMIGLPAELGTAPTDSAAGAARIADDGLIAIVTFGSSTCPQVPDSPATGTDSAVTVTFPTPTDGPCTLDYVPATTVIALPDGVRADSDLSVTIGDFGAVTLPVGSTEAVWVTG